MVLKISIVVPCYNMELYIEETIQSIVYQDYPNLELIVVDGGSTDNTLKVLAKYEKVINLLISEKDKGQYNAVNKGFSFATGDVFAWLNADDIYFPWTFNHVANFFENHSSHAWISGASSVMDENGLIQDVSRLIIAKPIKHIKNGWYCPDLYGTLQQEGMFWRKELWKKTGGLNENYKLAADFELWTRFGLYSELVSFGLPLASFRKRLDRRSLVLKNNYDLEVHKVCIQLKRVSIIKRYLGGKNKVTKILMRKFSSGRGFIYYFSALQNKWVLKKKRTLLSTVSFSSMISFK
jgi:glycosyltransferase involved in cell wall biosynthesis